MENHDNKKESWQAICRCRLCGEVFPYNLPVTKQEWVMDDLIDICDGTVSENTDQVRLVNVHDCKGMFRGSYGLADFLGYKLIPETE